MRRSTTNEPRRGCGYRKEGGLYLVGGGLSAPCGRLPIPLTVCPVCDGGIHPARGWTWILPRVLFGAAGADCGTENCSSCPVSHPPERAGLLWVGEKFYPSARDFSDEADRQGVSRRIHNVPKDFVVGETWVYLAHRKAVSGTCEVCGGYGKVSDEYTDREGNVVKVSSEEECPECKAAGSIFSPGVFQAFRPTAIEYVRRADDPEEKLVAMEKRGITIVRLERTDGQADLVPAGEEE